MNYTVVAGKAYSPFILSRPCRRARSCEEDKDTKKDNELHLVTLYIDCDNGAAQLHARSA
jgi:hypothetical protein